MYNVFKNFFLSVFSFDFAHPHSCQKKFVIELVHAICTHRGVANWKAYDIKISGRIISV